MRMTKAEFIKWAKQRVQFTENGLLSPYDPDVAENEVIDVIKWEDFIDLFYRIFNGDIIIEEMEGGNEDKTKVFYVRVGGGSENYLNVETDDEDGQLGGKEEATEFVTYAVAEEHAKMMPGNTSYIIREGYI